MNSNSKNKSKNKVAEAETSSSSTGQSKGSPEKGTADPMRLAILLTAGWIVPGAGHLLQRRWVRGLAFLALVCFSILMGAFLHGKLFSLESGRPLATLGTLATMGAGFPYLILRWLMDYQGDIRSATYEYGGAFLLTAGLMNFLALLDVWDVALGRKP